MRYRSKRYKHIRFRILVVLAIVIGAFYLIDSMIRPTITQMSAYSVNVYATKIINDAVLLELSSEEVSYFDLISLNIDDEGAVTALETNTIQINLLQASLVNTIVNKLQTSDYKEIKIPIGTLIGGNLTSGRGFPVTIRMIPTGSINSDITHKFEAAGINQTRHQIMLKITAKVTAIIPGYQTSVTVVTDICLAETVIVGKVPESFTEVTGDGSSIISKINDYAGE